MRHIRGGGPTSRATEIELLWRPFNVTPWCFLGKPFSFHNLYLAVLCWGNTSRLLILKKSTWTQSINIWWILWQMIPGTSNCGELGNRKAMDAIFDPSLCSSCQEAIVCFFKRIFWYSMLYQHSFPSSPQMSPLVLSNNADGEARIKIGHVAWELSSIVPITNQETFPNLFKIMVAIVLIKTLKIYHEFPDRTSNQPPFDLVTSIWRELPIVSDLKTYCA